MIELFEKDIRAVLGVHGEAFGVARCDVRAISLLGEGENHRNVLVETNRRKVVFRISLRIPAATDPAHEFESLRLLPPDLGPMPLWFDASCSLIPHPFAVLSYVEGEPRAEWSDDDLLRHARQLARLHAIRFGGAGPVGANRGRYDPCAFHRAIPKCYAPLLTDDRELAALVTEVGHYLAERAKLFLELRCYSLVHFDMYAGNVLFDKCGDVRYIDWEWMQIADNAEDLARFYGRGFGVFPWYVNVSEKSLLRFLDEYRSQFGDDATLVQRVNTLHVYYTLADLVYFRQAAIDAQAARRDSWQYREASRALALALKEALR
jgi:aminoglycoside phosphotransferase (APT) family kinase protein